MASININQTMKLTKMYHTLNGLRLNNSILKKESKCHWLCLVYWFFLSIHPRKRDLLDLHVKHLLRLNYDISLSSYHPKIGVCSTMFTTTSFDNVRLLPYWSKKTKRNGLTTSIIVLNYSWKWIASFLTVSFSFQSTEMSCWDLCCWISIRTFHYSSIKHRKYEIISWQNSM